MSYNVSVDGKIIGQVIDMPGMTLIGSALELAGDHLNTHGAPHPERNSGLLGEHGPKKVSVRGNSVIIETWDEDTVS